MKFKNYGKTINPRKELVLIFLGEVNNNYPQSHKINLIKRVIWIVPRIVCDTPKTEAHTFCTDANKSEKAGYKSEDSIKVEQSPYFLSKSQIICYSCGTKGY